MYSIRDAFRVPGLLSLARLPLALTFPWAVRKPAFAIAVLVGAAATDVADGLLARRRNEETPMGAVLDPLMDKVFVLAVVLSLIMARSLKISEALLLGTRELGELPLLAHLALQHRLISRPQRRANVLGKLATVMQFAAIAAILLTAPYRAVWIFLAALAGVLAVTSYWRREKDSKSAWSSR
jgi:phosphatidylglycerophosphate synthase